MCWQKSLLTLVLARRLQRRIESPFWSKNINPDRPDLKASRKSLKTLAKGGKRFACSASSCLLLVGKVRKNCPSTPNGPVRIFVLTGFRLQLRDTLLELDGKTIQCGLPGYQHDSLTIQHYVNMAQPEPATHPKRLSSLHSIVSAFLSRILASSSHTITSAHKPAAGSDLALLQNGLVLGEPVR